MSVSQPPCWDRMVMQRAMGCDDFVGRSLEPGSILRELFLFFSANIISNGFLLAGKAIEFLENSLISILNQMNAKYLARPYHPFFPPSFSFVAIFFLNNSFMTICIKNS